MGNKAVLISGSEIFGGKCKSVALKEILAKAMCNVKYAYPWWWNIRHFVILFVTEDRDWRAAKWTMYWIHSFEFDIKCFCCVVLFAVAEDIT